MKKDVDSPGFFTLTIPGGERIILYLRLGSVAGILVWLTLVVSQVEESLFLAPELIVGVAPLLLWFALYSVLLHALVSRRPGRIRTCFMTLLALDVVFTTLLVRATGGLNSTFFLAYYLLIAVNTFYLGLIAGAAATFMSSIGYLFVLFESPFSIFLGDFGLRIGFLFLVFFAMAMLSESEVRDKFRLQADKEKSEEMRHILESSIDVLADEKDAIEKTAEEKGELLKMQTEATQRRHAHLEFAKEINSQENVENAVQLFHRYISGMIEADDVSVIIHERESGQPTLYSFRGGSVGAAPAPPDHPLISAVLSGKNEEGEPLVLHPAEGEDAIPAGATVVNFPVRTLWADAVHAGETGITGILAVSSRQRREFAKDRMDEVRILGSHLAVAVENLKLRARLQEMAVTDGLTGVYNRRYFERSLERELRRAERYGRDLGLVMLDIDHFKKLNDRYGHPTGDAVLKEIAAIISDSVRNIDVVARYGGEEFALVVPETSLDGTRELAERLRKSVEEHRFVSENGKPIRATISLGVSAYPDVKTHEALIQTADEALYRSKKAGRNRVETALHEHPADEP
ncbi:MAG: diguanylate cyclase [bacterium]